MYPGVSRQRTLDLKNKNWNRNQTKKWSHSENQNETILPIDINQTPGYRPFPVPPKSLQFFCLNVFGRTKVTQEEFRVIN